MKRITIDYGDYCDETNDPREIKIAKVEGPRYRDEEGFFRVPRSGHVRNGVEYWLRGFGKLDRKPGPKVDIPLEAVKWFENRLGPAYVPYFIKDRELRVKLSLLIKNIGWAAMQRRIEEANKELSIVKAIHAAVDQAPPGEPAGSTVTESDMEDMFK